MKLFTDDIVQSLNSVCDGTPIYFVGLGAFDFQFAFAKLSRFQAQERVSFHINKKTYDWTEGPSDVPVWKLVNQIPMEFLLVSSETLRMKLSSGDYVDFFTTQSQFECVIINFGEKNDKFELEIF